MAVKDIGTVLARFDDTIDEVTQQVNSFHLRFITADGRLRTMHFRKNVAPGRQLRAPLQKRGKVMFNLQRHGTMLLQDLSVNEPRTVKVATFTHFKENNSSEWNRVRH